jgi:DNA-binding beta-propeller fold protein YncE
MTRAPLLAALLLLMTAGACEPAPPAPDDVGVEPTPTPQRATPDTEGPDPPATPEPDPTPRPRAVWVAVEDARRIALVDLDSQAVLEAYDTPGPPHNITVAPDGTIAASLYGTTDIALVSDGELVTVSLGDRPHDVKATGDWLVVANEAGRRIDLVTVQGEVGPSVPLRAEPHDVAVDPSGRWAWATMNGDDALAVVDLDAAAVDRYVPTGAAPHDLLFAPDGRLWVTDWQGRLLVLDGDEVVHSSELGVEAHHLAFTPDGGQAWITDHGANELLVLDTDTVELVEAVALPGAPHHLAIPADGALAAVADHTNGQLLVFRTETREQVGAVDVGAGPHGVWAAAPTD